MAKAKSKGAKQKNAVAIPRSGLTAEDKAWRARDDLRTLQSAVEIQSDKSRVAAAQREAKLQMQALAKVGKP